MTLGYNPGNQIIPRNRPGGAKQSAKNYFGSVMVHSTFLFHFPLLSSNNNQMAGNT